MIAALVDVLDAGQRVLLDRVGLLSIETRAALANTLASLALLLFGLSLVLVGWIAGNAVAILLLARSWSQAAAIALAAVVNLIVGGGALWLARRRVQAIAGSAAGNSVGNAVMDGGIVE